MSSRHEERMTARDNLFGDRCDLGGSLAYAQDDLGEPAPEFPVVIDTREAQIFQRRRPQGLEDPVRCRRRIEEAVADAIEKLVEL